MKRFVLITYDYSDDVGTKKNQLATIHIKTCAGQLRHMLMAGWDVRFRDAGLAERQTFGVWRCVA